MNDLYREILVKRRKSSSVTIIKAALIALTVLLAVGGFLFVPLMLILALAAGVGSWFYISRSEKEFEYLYVNGDFDIDVIYNMQKRKRAGSYDISDLVIFAPESSHELDSYRAKKGVTVKDYTSGEANKSVWCGVYTRSEGEEMMRIELQDPELVRDMRRFAPRKVFTE